MRRLSALLAAGSILLSMPVHAAGPIVPPVAVAETFCLARTVGDMSLVEPYISADLAYAIEKAMAQNDIIQKQAPDEKPPLGDGVPWQSYPDQAPECVVDYAAAEANPTQVVITYKFPDAPDASWSDVLVIKQVDGEWKIDDVVYKDGEHLTATLLAVFEN